MIFDYITKYNKEDIYPFHVPGHKRNKDFFESVDFLDYDMTEFGGMDNFHNAKGIILEAQKKASEIFGAKESYFVTNGSTGGIISSILSVCSENDKIIIARNCHRSVYNGVLLSGAKPVYIYPKKTLKGFIGGIDPNDVEEKIIKEKNIKAVVITSPTYEGFCSDIKAISKITKKYNVILIVDESHGSHFIFSEYFPESSVNYADIVIQSLHKTLPVLGQSSIVHSNIKTERLKNKISLLNTTSPSYILMSTIDFTLQKLDKNIFNRYTDLLLKYRNMMSKNKNIKLIGDEIINNGFVSDLDISKLTFFIHSKELTGVSAENLLASKYKIQIELSSLYHFVALSTVCDTEKGFLRLLEAVNDIDKNLKFSDISYSNNLKEAEVIYSFKEAEKYNSRAVNLSDAENKISSEFIIPYPPGIPLIAPGELITKEIIEEIKILKENNINFLGKEKIGILEDCF